MQAIRMTSLFFGTVEHKDTNFAEWYMNRSTADELEHAIKSFEHWWESIAEKHLSRQQQNEGYNAIYGLRDAYEQQAREEGMRTGLRLMHEALTDAPSVHEIERRGRK